MGFFGAAADKQELERTLGPVLVDDPNLRSRFQFGSCVVGGLLYGVAALVLGLRFIWLIWRLRHAYSDAAAKGVFRYSLTYLAAVFAALPADHYLVWLS